MAQELSFSDDTQAVVLAVVLAEAQLTSQARQPARGDANYMVAWEACQGGW